MSYSPASEIAELLEASVSGLNLSLGTSLFVDSAPSIVDKCAIIIDTPGFAPELNYVYEYPSIQILQRGMKLSYLDAYDTLNDIKMYLQGLHNITVSSGSRYILIHNSSDILSLGSDDNNRPLLSCNFILHRTR